MKDQVEKCPVLSAILYVTVRQIAAFPAICQQHPYGHTEPSSQASDRVTAHH